MIKWICLLHIAIIYLGGYDEKLKLSDGTLLD